MHACPAAPISSRRPQALNSLDTDMVERLSELLDAWNVPPGTPASPSHPSVSCVVVKGAGDKVGSCAGACARACADK